MPALVRLSAGHPLDVTARTSGKKYIIFLIDTRLTGNANVVLPPLGAERRLTTGPGALFPDG